MYDCRQFFINGEWIAPTGRAESLVINPATEEPVGWHDADSSRADRRVRLDHGYFGERLAVGG